TMILQQVRQRGSNILRGVIISGSTSSSSSTTSTSTSTSTGQIIPGEVDQNSTGSDPGSTGGDPGSTDPGVFSSVQTGTSFGTIGSRNHEEATIMDVITTGKEELLGVRIFCKGIEYINKVSSRLASFLCLNYEVFACQLLRFNIFHSWVHNNGPRFCMPSSE